jgi:hypothetical protein
MSRKLIAIALLLCSLLSLSAQAVVTPSVPEAPQSSWQTLDELLNSIETEANLSKAELLALSTRLTQASWQLQMSQIDRLELSRLSAWLGESYQSSEAARKRAENSSAIKNYVIGALTALAVILGGLVALR